MNAPQQKDLFSKRYRKVRAPDPKEYAIQIAVMQHFDWRKRDGVMGWHTANGGLRDKPTAALLKAMGLLPGVADLTFVWSELVSVVGKGLMIFPRVLFLEIKAQRGRQSAAQCEFEAEVTAKGCFYELAEGVDAGVAVLQKYGLLRKSR